MADKIYLLRGNDTPMAVCLRYNPDGTEPVPYDLSEAERVRLALVGHGMHIFARDTEVSGTDHNIVSGVIPGRSLLPGDYDLEITFNLDGRDKRFAVEDMFEAVDFLAEDADGETEGEGAGIFVTVTVQPELIEISGPAGPQGKSAYQVWLDDGHTGTEDDFFEWLAAQTPNPDWNQNDSTKADFIKNRTHWEEESSTTINDAKLAWSGSTPETLDFWFHGTDVHIPRTSVGWGLTWEGGELYIDDMESGYEIGVNDGEGWSVNPFDPSYDQQPYPLNVDVVIASETVHKLDNKYLDLDSTPALNSQKPVTSDGVKRALNALPTVPVISTNVETDGTSDSKTSSPKSVKTFVEGKGYYTKPQSGIPASDIAAGVIPTVPTDIVKYTSQSLTDAQKEQARTNIGAASDSEVSQLRSEAVVKAATTPTNVLYITDENGNEVLGLEKALLSRAAALFVTDGADGLLRVADAYPSIHADFSVSQGICEIYVRIGKTNKYVKFNYCHDVDTSEGEYKNIWRIGRSSPSGITGAVFCEYDGVTFSSTGKSALTNLENEFTMEFDGKGDHTGGTHGDERIDLDPSCYIQFIADGAQMDMSSDFHIDCRSFRVVQKSSLHETQEGGVVIAGHPIIAWHTKTTDFADGGYHIRNFIRVDLQNNAASMTTKSVYSGLTCIHKDAATKVWDESGFLFDATGSGTTYWGTGTGRYNHGKTPYTFMANATNKISCEVEAHENGGIEGTLVSNSKSEFTSYADRSSDTKYYCYEPNRVLVTGNRISLEMSVKFNVE